MTMTQKEIKKVLKYNPSTGIFTWKINSSRARINKKAGCIASKLGYIRITICYIPIFAHQLAFLYMTGKIPDRIDHKDGNPSNNKWNNLREATGAENSQNRGKSINNTSGYKGVHKRNDNRKNPWRSLIKVNNKLMNLGYYATAEEAASAYNDAAIKYHGKFAKLNTI